MSSIAVLAPLILLLFGLKYPPQCGTDSAVVFIALQYGKS